MTREQIATRLHDAYLSCQISTQCFSAGGYPGNYQIEAWYLDDYQSRTEQLFVTSDQLIDAMQAIAPLAQWEEPD